MSIESYKSTKRYKDAINAFASRVKLSNVITIM